MNVTVLPYIDQDYLNSLLEAQKAAAEAKELAAAKAAEAANTSFASTLENVVSQTPASNTAISTTNTVTCSDEALEAVFQKAADTYGVSANLLKAIAKAESNFTQYATSKSGAMGIMQLMPSTAAGLGVTDAYDIEQNIMGGANLISQLLVKYNGDTSLALAAYNAGSNNVDKYGGIPPFTETQNYVSKIMGYLQGNVSVSGSNTSYQPSSGLSTEAKEAVSDALDVIFSKLNINSGSLSDFVELVTDKISTDAQNE